MPSQLRLLLEAAPVEAELQGSGPKAQESQSQSPELSSPQFKNPQSMAQPPFSLASKGFQSLQEQDQLRKRIDAIFAGSGLGNFPKVSPSCAQGSNTVTSQHAFGDALPDAPKFYSLPPRPRKKMTLNTGLYPPYPPYPPVSSSPSWFDTNSISRESQTPRSVPTLSLPSSCGSSSSISGSPRDSYVASFKTDLPWGYGGLSTTPHSPVQGGFTSFELEDSSRQTAASDKILGPKSVFALPPWLRDVAPDDEMSRRIVTLGGPSKTSPTSHPQSLKDTPDKPASNHQKTVEPGLNTTPPPPSDTSTSPTKSAQGYFRPMQAVLNPSSDAHIQSRTAAAAAPSSPSVKSKFSDRYLGLHTPKNASHDHLADHQNCALWLQNLPPDVTHAELLGSIRGVGRVWATVINGPDERHATAAAKVIFFEPESASTFLNQIRREALQIRSFSVAAEYNRVKIPRQQQNTANATRVLIITGQLSFVNEENLKKYFQSRIEFQVDQVLELIRMAGRAVVEFRFGSYRCQAQVAKMALERERPEGFERAEFGPDPCETGVLGPSYGIATERILGQGL